MRRTLAIAILSLCACTVPQADPEPEAIPECSPLPSQSGTQRVEGLLFPVGSQIVKVEPEGPLIRVEAVVDKTPVQVREELESNAGLKILQIEDEGFEAEALVSDGRYRNFMKAVLVCEGRSRIRGYVTSEENGHQLPAIEKGNSEP